LYIRPPWLPRSCGVDGWGIDENSYGSPDRVSTQREWMFPDLMGRRPCSNGPSAAGLLARATRYPRHFSKRPASYRRLPAGGRSPYFPARRHRAHSRVRARV